MPDAVTPAANSGTEPPRRHISPWLLILGGGALAILIFGGFAVLTVGFHTQEPAPLGLQSAKMPDGRLLVLEDVTFGARHTFTVEMPRPGFSLLFAGTVAMPINETTQGDRLVVWLSCRDAHGRRYQDFEWWGYTAAVGESGEEFEDENPSLNGARQNGGMSSTSGSRPLSLARMSPGERFDRIIAQSSLPRVRHQGQNLKLRVYDLHDQLVAEFEVPDPSDAVKGAPPTWTPQPYPATATVDDLTVVLKELESSVGIGQTNGRDREYITIKPQLEISQNGQVTQDWYARDMKFSDALGNESSPYSFSLSEGEAAWKVSLRLFRKETAPFAPTETWTTTPVELAERDRGDFVNQSHMLGGVAIDVDALGGGGTVNYTNLGAARSSGAHDGSFDGKRFRIDTDWSYSKGGTSSTTTTTVTCELPHLAARISGKSENDDLRLLVLDDQQRQLNVHGPYVNADVHFWFLEPLPDTKQVAFKFLVQQGKSVEFIVAPPEIKHPPRRISGSEIIERLAAVTQSPLSFSSVRLGLYQILLAQPGTAELVRLSPEPSLSVAAAWSPDGTQIAYESRRDGNYDLFIMNADGTGERQLTDTPAAEHAPAWSPDGQRICFRRDTGDPALNWELFVINADGTGETNISNNPANDADPAWSPDGERIAFTSGRAEGRWCLYTMKPDGSDVQLLSRTSNGYVYPAWSPDGKRVAFTGSVDNHFEIYVIDVDGQNEQRLTQLGGLSMFAAWSPDGRHIAFLHRSDDMPGRWASLFVMRTDGSDLHEIAPIECSTDGGRPAWKPQPLPAP